MLTAFRFDGSRSVRIICQIDICIGQCNPVSDLESPFLVTFRIQVSFQTTCTLAGQPQTSFGRRRRQGTLNRPPAIKKHDHVAREDEDGENCTYSGTLCRPLGSG